MSGAKRKIVVVERPHVLEQQNPIAGSSVKKEETRMSGSS